MLRCRLLWLLPAAVMLNCAAPSSAFAGTVSRGIGANSDTLFFTASAGETNVVTVTHTPGTFTITDTGTPIVAGTGCSPVGTTVECRDDGVVLLWVTLADRADGATIAAATDAIVEGGSGNDAPLLGGSGADSIRGEDGDDDIRGGEGNDNLYGEDVTPLAEGTGHDTIDGGSGADTVVGGPGNDTVTGGLGSDRLYGGPDEDTLFGGEGQDRVSGEGGADRMNGDAGNDVVGIPGNIGTPAGLVPIESGDDSLDGGPDDDSLDPGGGGADDGDRLTGGAGVDTVSYGLRSDGVVVVKDGVNNDGYGGEGDEVGLDVERIVGGFDDDTLIGGPGADDIEGAGGNDTISGLGGEDVLKGGTNDGGNDTVDGGSETDTVLGDGGNDDLAGGAGQDAVHGGASEDVVTGGGGNDRLNGDGGRDELVGGGGADRMVGGEGRDTAIYRGRAGAIEVTLDGRANDGATRNRKSEGDNVESDVEDLTGAQQQDSFVGDTEGNRLRGRSGEDYIDGRRGADLLAAGAGRDVVRARDGRADRVVCGPSVDFAIVDPRDRVKKRGAGRCEAIEDGSTNRPKTGRLVFTAPDRCGRDDDLTLHLPRSSRVVPLVDAVRLPVGSVLDPDGDCPIRLVAAGREGARARATVRGAEFRMRQRRSGAGLVTLRLVASGCRGGSRGGPRRAHAARHRRPPYAFLVRRSSGRRHRGRRAATIASLGVSPLRVRAISSIATATGPASWTTVERCATTRTIVTRGSVDVLDLRRRRHVHLSSGDSYTARRR